MDEIRSVRSIARGSGGEHVEGVGARLDGQRLEAMQRDNGAFDTVLIHAAGGINTLAEPAHDLLVEKDRRRAAQPLVDDEADRVRADIDDGDRGNAPQTPLRFRFYHSKPNYCFWPRFQPAIRLGELDLRASPRPERLGFVMK